MAFTLWKDKEQRIVDPKLFSSEAEAFAKTISQEAQRNMNKGTQLRNFYDEVVRLNVQAQDQRNSWEVILPQVHMIIAKAAYAQGRELVSASFVQRIREGIEQIETPQDLKVFTNHLEAFMGFYKMYNPR